VKNFALFASSVFRPTAGHVYTELGGELAILNTKTGIYFGLDPVGARVWCLILEFRTAQEIREALLAEYDVDPAELETDLLTLFSDLLNKGLIEIAPPDAKDRALAAARSESQGA
jgi:hypothetical protein